MLTIRIRWKILYEVICWLKGGHDFQEYAIIHAAWNTPGKYCTLCRRSYTREYTWGIVDGTMTEPQVPVEKLEPWFKVEVR